MLFNLTDPRLGSNVYPKNNIIIEQAVTEVLNKEQSGLLADLLMSLLERNQDSTINIAINLAPSLEITEYIWHSLNHVLESSKGRQLLAIPVIVVAGSAQSIGLDFAISSNAVQELFAPMFETINYIHPSLISVNQLSQVSPSVIYAVNNNKNQYVDKLANPESQELSGEDVYLRFLLLDVSGMKYDCYQIYQNTKMKLMHVLLESIKQDGLTVFVIPDMLVPLNKAYFAGNVLYQEIVLSVALSNLAKKSRMQHKNTRVKLSTDNVNSIILQVFADAEYQVTLKWELSLLDDFDYVCSQLNNLFTDLQLEVV